LEFTFSASRILSCTSHSPIWPYQEKRLTGMFLRCLHLD
jgi:hypothetical protein